MSGARLAMNVVAFQAAWLGTVGGAAVGRLWIGPVAAAAIVMLHAALAAQWSRELTGVAFVAALGTLWDIVPAAAGLIVYRGGVAELAGVPYWIVALWLAFATTLNVSLRWLRTRRVLALVLGAAAGPLCYVAAARLGALDLLEPKAALAVQAAAWAVLLPVTLSIAERYDGVTATLAEGARV